MTEDTDNALLFTHVGFHTKSVIKKHCTCLRQSDPVHDDHFLVSDIGMDVTEFNLIIQEIEDHFKITLSEFDSALLLTGAATVKDMIDLVIDTINRNEAAEQSSSTTVHPTEDAAQEAAIKRHQAAIDALTPYQQIVFNTIKCILVELWGDTHGILNSKVPFSPIWSFEDIGLSAVEESNLFGILEEIMEVEIDYRNQQDAHNIYDIMIALSSADDVSSTAPEKYFIEEVNRLRPLLRQRQIYFWKGWRDNYKLRPTNSYVSSVAPKKVDAPVTTTVKSSGECYFKGSPPLPVFSEAK